MRWMSSRWVARARAARPPRSGAPAALAGYVEESRREPEPVERPDPLAESALAGRSASARPFASSRMWTPGLASASCVTTRTIAGLLRRRALQELGAGRRVEEEVADLDRRPAPARRPGPDSVTTPPSRQSRNPARAARSAGTRSDDPRNREDGGQRLPAEAERADRVEVGLGPELRGRVPLEREEAVLRRASPARRRSPRSADGRRRESTTSMRASPPRRGCSPPAPDDGRGALDDLAGGDLVDDRVREALDRVRP